MTEIKELLAEELTLLKRIQCFGKEQTIKKMNRSENVRKLLLYRIYSNLYSALLITTSAYKKGNISFFQLPLGILLRCTFTDCLFALYVQRVDRGSAIEELDLRTIEYANSLLERREVYKDQVKSTGLEYDDAFLDHLYELTLEDNFLSYLTFDETKVELEVTKLSKEQLRHAGFAKSKSTGIKEQRDFLLKQNDIHAMVKRLYAYYKYFSQYEHFSENGQGDVLASQKENGNDNIHLPSAIQAMRDGLMEVMKENIAGK